MITEVQREERRESIGSSDVPAILGLSPWATPADIYWSKVGKVDRPSSSAMDTGNLMEPVILDWAENYLNTKILRDVRVKLDYKPFAVNLDGSMPPDAVVEAKYVGPGSADYWGSTPEDVPDYVAAQVQFQMAVTGFAKAWVPAAIVRPFTGLSFEMFVVDRDEDTIGAIVAACLGFWNNHVLPKVPPVGVPSLETLKFLRRDPVNVTELDDESGAEMVLLLLTRSDLKAREALADKEIKEIERRILLLLGDREAAKTPGGTIVKYALESAGDRLDLKKLRADEPDIFEAYSEATTRRVLRIKEPKTVKGTK